MKDQFEGFDKSIDSAGSGCLWIILIMMSIIAYVIVF